MSEKEEVDKGWMRYPQAKVRMRMDGIDSIIEGLSKDGFCHGGHPVMRLIDEGIYIEMSLNVGQHGSIVALPIEVLIPIEKVNKKPGKKMKGKKKKIDEATEVAEDTNAISEPVVEPVVE